MPKPSPPTTRWSRGKVPTDCSPGWTETKRPYESSIVRPGCQCPNGRLTPAAEWLLDNFYLIEEQIQMARRHLPRGYSRELPRLLNGPSAGLPRVYDIVLELISHVDAQIDAEPLGAFIAAYQTVRPLKLGELWAIPIMLRLGLIENLQRITTRLSIAREDRELADLWVDRLQEMAEKNPSHLVVVVADMAKVRAALVQFVRGGILPAFVAAQSGLASRAQLARTAARRTRDVHRATGPTGQPEPGGRPGFGQSQHRQPAFLERDGLEGVRGDAEPGRGDVAFGPGRCLRRMDFATRDRYRHAVEAISRHSAVSGSGSRATGHSTWPRKAPGKMAATPGPPMSAII